MHKKPVRIITVTVRSYHTAYYGNFHLAQEQKFVIHVLNILTKKEKNTKTIGLPSSSNLI